MTKRVLITGAEGALGRALTSRLRKASSDAVLFTPGRCGADDSLDLLHRDQIQRTIENTCPDLILNLAATFSNDFDEAYAVNVAATRHFLEAIEASGRRVRVVLVGSAAEYGPVMPKENPISEDHVLRPVSVYGLTKAWQTELAYLYAYRGLDVVVARIFNLVGPNLSDHLFVGRLHKQIGEIRRGVRSRIEVGPLSAVRDYLSIDDAVTQLLAVSNYGDAGKVYHIASGQPITMRDLLVRELSAHGLDESIVVEGAALTNRRGYDVPVIYADMTRTNALLEKRKHDEQN